MQKNNTKNINLYPLNNKLNNNLINLQSANKFVINSINPNIGIHKYLFSNNYLSEESVFIFNSSALSNEIIQFISSFHDKFRIVIFIDNNNTEVNQLFSEGINLLFLIPENITISSKRTIVLSNFCIDSELYGAANKIDKVDQIIHFIHPSQLSLTDKLSGVLYPSSQLKIKMFDNPYIKHPLNIGNLTEIEKQELLSISSYYLHDNSFYYVAEALTSGCLCLNLDNPETIQEQMKNNTNNSSYIDIKKNITSYNDLLERIYNYE